MPTLSFGEAAVIRSNREILLHRLMADAPKEDRTESQGWTLLADGRGVVIRSSRTPKNRPHRTTITETTIRLTTVSGGTQVSFEVSMEFVGTSGWTLVLVRPMARRGIKRSFTALIHALETGDLSDLHAESRKQRRTTLRVQTLRLSFLLVMGLLCAGFIALVSFYIGVAIALLLLIAAIFPVRRIQRARKL